MKILLTLLLALCSLQAQSLYVLEDTPALESKSKQELGIIIKGAFGEKVREDSQTITLQVKGFVKKEDPHTLYATPSMIVPLIIFEKINRSDTLEITLDKNKLTENPEVIWQEAKALYYAQCSTCHQAPPPSRYSALHWQGIFASMRKIALLNDKESTALLEYLQAHASDTHQPHTKEQK